MITKALLEDVKSRADVLSRRYYFLESEDLVQDGLVLLLNLEKTSLTNLQKHKAVNNMFSNIERHALYQLKIEKNMSSFDFEVDAIAEQEDPEEILEREEITNQLMQRLTRQELLVLDWLTDGKTISEIAELLNYKHDTVRKIVMKIIAKREEIEDAV